MHWIAPSEKDAVPELTTAERDEVKRVAHLLLKELKTLLTFNWRQTTQARARVRDTIKETLDLGLPRIYEEPIYKDKCARLFAHVYENYVGGGGSIFRA